MGEPDLPAAGCTGGLALPRLPAAFHKALLRAIRRSCLNNPSIEQIQSNWVKGPGSD